MANRNVIILNGMRRGGTNIVWNLLQSHPRIVSPVRETGQIIYPKWMRRGRVGNAARRLLRIFVQAGFSPCLRDIDRRLYESKMATIAHRDNKYKSPYTTYTATELEEAVLVAKSVGDEVFITPSLAKFFPVAHCISVVRDAFSVCDGWNRRGVPVERAAMAYRREMSEIVRQNETLERHLLVKFEDCLTDPLGQLDNMCRFVGVDANEIAQIRIKAKKVVNQSGTHVVVFGNEGEKSWIDKKDVEAYLDSSVSDRQRRRLSDDERKIIVEIAGDAMAALGYEITDQGHAA